VTTAQRPRLTGRRALVTGAGRGVGAAIARRLADEGAAVALLDRDRSTVDAVAQEIADGGGTSIALAADVTDRAALASELARVRDAFGNLDTLVNNAGRWTICPFLQTDPGAWQSDLGVNLVGTLQVVHLLLADMVERRFGRIINIVSDSARTGEPNVAVYAAAKAGVGGFTRALAKEVGPDGVTVNCVSLSTTVTPGAMESFTTEQVERMPRFYPLRRLGRPEDAAGAVAFLASDDASWITGQTLGVNGGYAITP
jgi:2-hydroxycyclohexanecarboxyl-CoA dehydrogenase